MYVDPYFVFQSYIKSYLTNIIQDAKLTTINTLKKYTTIEI